MTNRRNAEPGSIARKQSAIIDVIRSNKLGTLFLLAAALAALMLGYLVWDSAADKGSAPILKGALFLVGVIFALASIVVGWEKSNRSKIGFNQLAQRKLAGTILLGIFGAFSVMTDALALFEPRSAIESQAGAIEAGIDNIRTSTRRLEKVTEQTGRDTDEIKRGLENAGLLAGNSKIREALPGIWGEKGCEVTYRFDVKGRSVTLTSIKSVAGMRPYSASATIINEQGNKLVTSSNSPEQGVTVEMTYQFDGTTERLVHHDMRQDVRQDFVRCSA